MAFNELGFWFLCLPVLLAYWLLPHKGRRLLLLISSCFFYGLFDWRLIILILVSTITDFYGGYFAAPPHRLALRRFALGFSIFVNLTVLITFKYFYFYFNEIGFAAFSEELSWKQWLVAFGFPVGISFFTFQTLSYTIDCYKKRIQPIQSILDFCTFVSFFPQLIAGPIERAGDLLPQLQARKFFKNLDWNGAVSLLLLGLVKKNFFAAYLTKEIQILRVIESPTGPQLAMMGFLMTFLVYVDFSGYSDIGRGLAKLFGIELMINFRPFYYAKNPIDFWLRWNLTLTTWIRDYIVFPLIRLSRHPLWPHMVTLSVMALIGIWHKATLTWLLFGLWQGVMVEVYRACKGKLPEFWNSLWGHITAHSLMISALTIMGLLHFAGYWERLKMLLSYAHTGWTDWAPVFAILIPFFSYYTPMFVYEFLQEKTKDYDFIVRRSWIEKSVFATIALVYVYWARDFSESPFIYFHF